MKVRQTKKAISRFWNEQKKASKKKYCLFLSSKIVAMEICLEQLLENPNKMVYDEMQVHFRKWEWIKYKTLKTAFLKDMIREGYEEIKFAKQNKIERF